MGRPKGSKNKPKVTPGTKEAVAAVAVAGFALPENYTNEAIEKNNVGKDKALVEVKVNEWDKQIFGAQCNPFREKEKELQALHPDLAFRVMNPNLVEAKGRRGWEPYYDKDGKTVTVGDGIFGYRPKENAEKRNAYYREKALKLKEAAKKLVDKEGAAMSRATAGLVGAPNAREREHMGGDIIETYQGRRS